MTTNSVARTRKVPTDRVVWERKYMARKAKGQSGWLPRQPVAKHVKQLQGWGLPLNSIAAAAGVGAQTVHDVTTGRSDRLQVETFFRLRQVSYRPVPEQVGHKVLAVGAQRRLCALRRMGYSSTWLRDELGSTVSYVMGVRCVTWSKWHQIAVLYDRVSMVPGPSRRTRLFAEGRGWPSPLDWESVDIDDPEAVPLSDRNVGSAVQRRAALAQGLLGEGLCASVVAGRLGVTVRSVERWKNVVIEDE